MSNYKQTQHHHSEFVQKIVSTRVVALKQEKQKG